MSDYEALQELLETAENVVFFGGAGVSTESGIPDFRGSQGLYRVGAASYAPEEILHHRFFLRHPDLFYQYYFENMVHPHARPNAAHYALARLEEQGKLRAVITQNIDGLHQKAGSQNVIELHGSVWHYTCMGCGKRYPLESVLAQEDCPVCPVCPACGGLLRPDVVLYGESLDSAALEAAEEAIGNADVLLVGGTSLVVQPAAGLVAGYAGDHLVLINKTPTPFDGMAELILRDPIGEVFENLGNLSY